MVDVTNTELAKEIHTAMHAVLYAKKWSRTQASRGAVILFIEDCEREVF